jgi:hypothetical protein
MDSHTSMTRPAAILLLLPWISAAANGAPEARAQGPTPAETAAGIAKVDAKYPELDIRRYGAVCDYDAKTEKDGQVARAATDNLPAFNAAIAVARKRRGGKILVDTGGDCYVSNSINAKGIDNLWFEVAKGTTVRATRYTNMGSLFLLGNTDENPEVRNVGVEGGGIVRTFRPRHSETPVHRNETRYALGSYVLATDRNGEKRAYYAKRAGVSGKSSPPTVINGSQADGTVVWQDADNDNVISISGIGASVIGMNIPEASGKPITVQKPRWKNVTIRDNVIGATNDKAIEVKGQHGSAGQEDAFGEGVRIVGNTIDEAGREGIEVEQSMHGVHPNRDCEVSSNVVRSAGLVNRASGIRINRCEGVRIRGNRVLRAAGNGIHLRLCRDVAGDLYAENSGEAGVHLQEVSGFSLDSIVVKGAARSAVMESGNAKGGRIGKLEVERAAEGYRTFKRSGPAPVIDEARFSGLSGPEFRGSRPDVKRVARPQRE